MKSHSFMSMMRILWVGLCLMSFSAAAEGPRKISPQFREEMLSTSPEYCSGHDNTTIDCSQEEQNSFSNLLTYKSKMHADNFRNDLINISIKSLLKSKADALGVFPELIPPDKKFRVSSPVLYRKPKETSGKAKVVISPVAIDADGDSRVKSCLEQNSEIKLSEFDRDLTQELQKFAGDISSKQKEFIAEAILDSMKVNAVWDEKNKNKKELESLYDERIKFEKELKTVEDVNAGRFYEEKNKHVTNSFLGVTSQELRIVAQNEDQRIKRQFSLNQKLKVVNEKISRILLRTERIEQVAYKNPILIESTAFIERGLFKKSPFLEQSLKFIEDQKGTFGKTLSGKRFLSSFNKSFSQDLGPDLDGQVLARIELMLENNPQMLKDLMALAQESMKQKIQDLDGSIKEICSTSGKKLQHFKPLVQKAMAQNILEAKKEGLNIITLEKELKKTHCEMLRDIPYVESHVGVYAAIGSGMLATGVLAPVGVGVILTGGGLALTAVGAYETNDALETSRLAQGLSAIQLADRDRAREDVSNLRVAASWTAVDGAFFPLKPFVIGSKLSQIPKTKSVSPQDTRLAFKDVKLPAENWPMIALGRDENKRISNNSTLEEFAEKMGKHLQRNLVTYKKFTETPYLVENEKWFKISPEYSVKTVEKTVRAAVEMHPDKKVIIFDLDNYDPSFLKNQKGEDVFSYTNFEVRLICNDRKIFDATVWYLKGEVLTNSEIKRFFGKHIDCSP